jgi:hypothetical protein
MTYEELDATVAAKKDSEDLSETSYTRSTRSGNQLQLSAKFRDPIDKALSYRRDTARDFHRVLADFLELKKSGTRTSADSAERTSSNDSVDM